MTKAFERIGKAFQAAFKGKEADAKQVSKGLLEISKEADQQQEELDKLKQRYQALYLTQGEEGDTAKEVAREIEKLSGELKQNKDKLKEAEKAADKLDQTQEELDDSADKASDSVKDLGDEAKNTDGKFTIMKGAIANLISNGLTKLIDLAAEAGKKLLEFGKDSVEAAAAVSAENSSFDQIMGDYAGNAQRKMQAVADSTGVVATRLTSSMTSMTAKFKGLGFGVEDATTLAANGLTLASDAAAFWDKTLDDSMGALNSFLNGSYEGGEAIGLFANDTQMAAYAVEKGIVSETKAWANLDEATKQATRLEYAQNMMTASGAVGQAAKESDQYANTQANLTEKWRQFKAEVGEPILQEFVNPAMAKLSEWVDKARTKFQEISPKIGEFKDKLGEWWDKAQSVASFVSESFQPVLDALKGAWDGLKEAVSPLTEKLSAFVESGGAASTAMSLFSGACDAVATAISTLSAFVSPVIETISSTIAEHLPKWKERFQEIGENLNWLKPIIAVIGTVFAYVVSYVSGILNGFASAIDGVFQVIEGIFQSFEGAFDMIVGLLTGDMDRATDGALNMQNGMVNIFGGLWNTVSGYLSGFLNGFKDTFSGIYDAVSEKFGAVKTFVSGVVDWLKGIFDFSWNLPEIKLPHFSMTGEFSIDPPSVPHFGIEWYAKGAVLNQPTIFGLNPDTGAAMIGGEAGAEAVAPIATLQQYVSDAVRDENRSIVQILSSILNLISSYLPQILTASSHEIKMESKTVARLLASDMNRELGALQNKSKRGVPTS